MNRRTISEGHRLIQTDILRRQATSRRSITLIILLKPSTFPLVASLKPLNCLNINIDGINSELRAT